MSFKFKPTRLGPGPTGNPAIEWLRHGVAALGEASTVSRVVEYESEEARLQALGQAVFDDDAESADLQPSHRPRASAA